MSDLTPRPGRPVASGADRPLVDRLRDRVVLAHETLERRDRAGPPRTHRRTRPRRGAAGDARIPLSQEVRALRKVFVELGAVYHEYRRRTGAPVSVPLRTAATAFKDEPSLMALVPVAGFLDDLELLDW
jgi:hypothetical protein